MKIFRIYPLFFILILFSCTTTSKLENSKNEQKLDIVICGDIMAHTQNFKMKNFDLIWDDIRPITQSSDLTIANIEAPINDNIPFENYPTFNMQYSYPQAAIDAGINVITIANNHTNDKLKNGILSTAKWAKEKTQEYENSLRPIYISGLKKDVLEENPTLNEVSFCSLEKKDFKILFLGVTQSLNTLDSAKYINFFPNTQKSRIKLIETIQKIKTENPSDIFILALHTDEPEYILDIDEKRRQFYYELLNAGVDILWANHCHVIKPIEYIGSSKTGKIKKVILYSTGNTISGQRRRPNFNNPNAIINYTGDGTIVSLQIKKDINGIYLENSKINYITTLIDDQNNYLIKVLNENLYNSLENTKNLATDSQEQNCQSILLNNKKALQWKNFLIKREEILRQIKEITTWQ